MASVRKRRGPSWVPTRRQMLVHVNNCVLLWALSLSWFVLGVRIDTVQDNRITPGDVWDMVIVSIVFVIWGVAAYALSQWARKPPSSRARIAEGRQVLTGLANAFESEPTKRTAFRALITAGIGQTLFHPRFTNDSIEFGNLTHRHARATNWFYLAVQLPVPLPHLILSSHWAGGLANQLPVQVGSGQRLSLEGDFDNSFHAFAPGGYEPDALFLLTPDVMAALIDHAAEFNVEMVDDRVIFFTPALRNFAQATTWQVIDELLHGALPPLVNAAVRYRDERVGGQNGSHAVASILAAIETPATPWEEAPRSVGPEGKRLKLRDMRAGWWGLLGQLGWLFTLGLLYIVPSAFLFAAIMSIVDGR